MKPLSEEELSEVAWQSFLKYKSTDEIISTYCDGFKQGYAKCIEQMSEEFNGLISVFETLYAEQMKGGDND